jgi:lipopolysaccharide assembly outer membrane protein LptD (OstA)
MYCLSVSLLAVLPLATPLHAAAIDGSDGRVVADGLNPDDAPVDLEADHLTHDEGTQTVIATGNVELIQSGRILKADTVSYNLATDRVRATGNVVLSERDGTTYFADDVELTDDMKDGFVEGLNILLADGGPAEQCWK